MVAYFFTDMKNVYILHIAGYNNKSGNMISLMYITFHRSLHVTVVA